MRGLICLGEVGQLSSEEVRAISDIQQRLVRVETKLDDIIEDLRTAAESRDIARDAFKSSELAHQRINGIKDNQRWLWRTVIGGVIAAMVAFFTKFKGGI